MKTYTIPVIGILTLSTSALAAANPTDTDSQPNAVRFSAGE